MSQSVTTQTEQGLYINPEALTAHLPALHYQNDALHMEQVSITEVVKHYGTPCYVYSKQAILAVYQAYTDSFASLNHQICYAVKANSNLAVLGVLAQAGAGFDIVSRGELMRVLAAGGEASRVVFSGVGKTYSDIEYALNQSIGCFNVESISELTLINDVAKALDKSAPISLRVNPDVDAKTHPYISTGLKDNKFGIAHEDALVVYQQAAKLSHINIVGIDCHIGSQLTEVEPFVAALDKVIELVHSLGKVGIELRHIDLGGGLGVRYIDETPVSIDEFANALLPKLSKLGLTVFFEPGRSIVANAGILLTQVDVLKPTEHKNFAIVDAAMNDLIRPALYQAEMAVIPSALPNNGIDTEGTQPWDIVGAICETGDFLAKDRLLSLATGDVLAITGAGAYGFTMSSNYNSRPRASEVMVADDRHQLIRKRESIEALYADEVLWQG
ncbi:diaminopimelate decarboxylase [Psychrobacter arcticus 273-4]|uniref:Diaminopimelate decarboxylase n=1 Tax=Psychrobacter arcticus (strain DSM 17307 / VKM B-2377 / 273-4) TaxID=259536 RepID=Q4FV86_PSYA2|nr:diaminopimelate decarboxylase [Psychrobacter arcticus]AAZ18072.1 diaminopimelate decarboxylase [Psychrobacter arcticus 273-4]